MKVNLKVVFSLVVVSLVSAAVFGQKTAPKSDTNALMFQISGNGLKKPSYIFGTFHILCPTDMIPLDKFSPYIDQADQLVMEVDMDDPAETTALTSSIMNSDGRSIKDVLTPEQYAKVDEMFKNALGSSVEPLKMLKPSLLSILVITSPKMLGCSPPSSYDLSLVKIAGEKKKPIFGLETVAFQSQTLDSKPMEKQAKELYEMALDPQKPVNQLKSMIVAYKSQDIEKLYLAATEDEKSDVDFQKKLLEDRNTAWIPKIEAFVKDKPTFIAVGAGHLGGKNGVIQLLRAKGYDVKAVRL
jgi:uncharacterized protein YbaP (TraB family)